MIAQSSGVAALRPVQQENIFIAPSGQSHTDPHGIDELVPTYFSTADFTGPYSNVFPSTVPRDFMEKIEQAVKGSSKIDAGLMGQHIKDTALGKKLSSDAILSLTHYATLLGGFGQKGGINRTDEKEIARSINKILTNVETGGLLPAKTWGDLGQLLHLMAGHTPGQTNGKKNSRIINNAIGTEAKTWLQENDRFVEFKDIGRIHISELVFAVGLIAKVLGDTFMESSVQQLVRHKEKVMERVREIKIQIEKSARGNGLFGKIFKWVVIAITALTTVFATVVSGGALSVLIPAVVSLVLMALDDQIVKGLSFVLQKLGCEKGLAEKLAMAFFVLITVAVGVVGTTNCLRHAGAIPMKFGKFGKLGRGKAAKLPKPPKPKIDKAARLKASKWYRATNSSLVMAQIASDVGEAALSVQQGVCEGKALRAEAKTYEIKSSIVESKQEIETQSDMIQTLLGAFIPQMWDDVNKMTFNSSQSYADACRRFG